jgi:hypothetical protein
MMCSVGFYAVNKAPSSYVTLYAPPNKEWEHHWQPMTMMEQCENHLLQAWVLAHLPHKVLVRHL